MNDRGWGRVPRKARGALERLGIEHEEVYAQVGGKLLLFAPAPIAAVCSVLKGPMLAWTLRQMRDDFDFLEALVAVTRIDERPIAIVAFASTQYENRVEKKKKAEWCPGCGGARLPARGACVLCGWPNERTDQ